MKTAEKYLILTNSSSGLHDFRRELLSELIKNNKATVSTPDSGYIDELRSLGCSVIETAVDRRGVNPKNDLKLLFRYLKLIKAEKPDAVITYTVKPNIYGGIACRLSHIPYFPNITGLGTAIENPGILQSFLLMLYRIGIKKAECVFFQNKHNMDFMEKHRVRGKSRRLLPGSGVNLIRNNQEPYPEDNGYLKFLFVGRIMKDKGIGELLSCIESVTEAHPNVSFSIAGDYDELKYKDDIDRLGAAGKLNYLGYRKDIHDLMAQHHAIIHPSYHEGLSNVLLEAAACGRPVITTNVPGCRETFDEGVSGFGVDAKDAKALTDAVLRFIDLPYEEKIAMGMAGREKVVREFDRNIVIDAYLEEIEKLKK